MKLHLGNLKKNRAVCAKPWDSREEDWEFETSLGYMVETHLQ